MSGSVTLEEYFSRAKDLKEEIEKWPKEEIWNKARNYLLPYKKSGALRYYYLARIVYSLDDINHEHKSVILCNLNYFLSTTVELFPNLANLEPESLRNSLLKFRESAELMIKDLNSKNYPVPASSVKLAPEETPPDWSKVENSTKKVASALTQLSKVPVVMPKEPESKNPNSSQSKKTKVGLVPTTKGSSKRMSESCEESPPKKTRLESGKEFYDEIVSTFQKRAIEFLVDEALERIKKAMREYVPKLSKPYFEYIGHVKDMSSQTTEIAVNKLSEELKSWGFDVTPKIGNTDSRNITRFTLGIRWKF